MREERSPDRPFALRVGNTIHAGRGVFACERIPAGSLIEECPVIEIPEEELVSLMPTTLGDYFFQWGPTRQQGALALGYGSLYNHSYHPSAGYVRKLESRTIQFLALRDIEAGEEITVNYNGSPEDRSPVWF
ncbi:MAG: SET domain-containing protein [Myxococcales bacterium]|nr:SET domain-containing protein [Polyangiaceae bacterium]MDW8247847.1 SET domain-containing protein [Myxococcales bacterium]